MKVALHRHKKKQEVGAGGMESLGGIVLILILGKAVMFSEMSSSRCEQPTGHWGYNLRYRFMQ